MQTQIALSTIEAEYSALSKYMRDLIPIREILKEIRVTVFGDEAYKPKCTTHCKSFKDATSGDALFHNQLYTRTTKHAWSLHKCPNYHQEQNIFQYHFIGLDKKIVNLEIQIQSIPTTSQLSDQLTKGLPQE
jgi:hypothetical protein